MTIKPDLLALLDATSSSLAERVVPSLGGAERYEALLAISAIGTVIREISGAGERSRDEVARLTGLLGRTDNLGDDSPEALEHELAGAIRAGRFSDEEDTRALIDYLNESCRRTLQITNPKVAESYPAS